MVEVIDRDIHQKIYLQLYNIFKKKIEEGEWKVNSKIPSEKELCKIFNVSRTSVRAAIGELVREGYLIKVPGKGTFVIKKTSPSEILMIFPFKEIWLENNPNITSKVLIRTVLMPVDELAEIFQIPLTTHLIYIKRLWLIDEKVTALQEIYVPYFVCPYLLEEDLEKISVIETIEKKAGVKITKVDISIEIFDPPEEIKRDIGLFNEKVMLIQKKLFSGPTLVGYLKVYKKKDPLKIKLKLERKSL